MAYRISELHGVLPTHIPNLAAAGIRDTENLLSRCGKAAGRAHINGLTGIPEETLLFWARRADLMRIPRIGNDYAELLEESGIDTLAELSSREPAMLRRRLMSENEFRCIVKVVPGVAVMKRWVATAKKLTPAFKGH